MVQDGPTNTGYGTTNADAGEGIGMLKGIRKNIKKEINSHTYVLWWAIIPKSCLCKEPTYVRKNVIEVTLRASAHPMCMAWSILLRRFQRTLQERVPSHIIPHIPQVANTLQQVNGDFILFSLSCGYTEIKMLNEIRLIWEIMQKISNIMDNQRRCSTNKAYRLRNVF